jgi:hypothetical protein
MLSSSRLEEAFIPRRPSEYKILIPRLAPNTIQDSVCVNHTFYLMWLTRDDPGADLYSPVYLEQELLSTLQYY